MPTRLTMERRLRKNVKQESAVKQCTATLKTVELEVQMQVARGSLILITDSHETDQTVDAMEMNATDDWNMDRVNIRCCCYMYFGGRVGKVLPHSGGIDNAFYSD